MSFTFQHPPFPFVLRFDLLRHAFELHSTTLIDTFAFIRGSISVVPFSFGI